MLPPLAHLWRPAALTPIADPAASPSPERVPSAPAAPRRAPRNCEVLRPPVLGILDGFVCVLGSSVLLPALEPLSDALCTQTVWFIKLISGENSLSVRVEHCKITEIRNQRVEEEAAPLRTSDQSHV